jgi:protein-L-isoaspartate(D-aspartate) O-methyltransferase
MIWGVHQSRIERAVRAVRREFFVPADQRARAGDDAALPIGHRQTISQPSLVAYMTEQLRPTERSRVLEVGTGSGYQTAILAELAETVYTIERLPELADAAHARLDSLGYRNIKFRIGDGALGWPEAAPFDRVMVTAAATEMPSALTDQLKPGGRLVGPIGSVEEDNQLLILLEKDDAGNLRQTDLCPVRFVPFISDRIRPN